MFIGTRRPPRRAASVSSIPRAIDAKRPPTMPSRAAASTSSSRRGARGSIGWKRWPKPETNLPCSATYASSAARQQPDHLREAHAADQLLDRVAAEADHAGAHLDDAGAPPVDARLSCVEGIVARRRLCTRRIRLRRAVRVYRAVCSGRANCPRRANRPSRANRRWLAVIRFVARRHTAFSVFIVSISAGP
jgi:hypothetical protein